ncbi:MULTISPECIES: Eco57I restriction-modification methylase domain-containing protein [unclassified Haloferax]|uniref:Eco57I restriction-modification methylase domain-containing protein n=1 Tax=unclassified Haloferax TaxID=2625095 RepID=UPI0002B1A75D|nr:MULTISPECIES: N-6 DNA methylase [unclassified Haloferax]ELZ60718.1 type i restriction-modification system methyltransferase subunit [Haloferax sp. ATCC BAA-646]ELZ65496.1 type i restriction-modification system methyltransferase subunit [Haloferax sp. ATCC BAA-645]ELZ69034.1 type i restriction-modification system methyltransferase subunit [Haloferax sp. ATCC BAA-644]
MSDAPLRELHDAISSIHSEIRHEGSEFDFRYSLVDHLFTDALDWSRTEGEGHVNFEDDRKDLLFYDDSEPPFPVIVCETKRPSHDLDLDDVEQLETYMNGVGSARFGILTNGHEFRLYEYESENREISGIDGFNVDAVAETNFENLSEDQQNALGELEYLRRSRYVDFGDAEYFRETYQEVPVQYQPGTDDEGYELFLEAVKNSLDELTDVLKVFFDDYRDRDEGSYPKEFLDSTFPDWKEWREYTGRSKNAKEAFCRETAYIILNRALFARIAEDKEIVGHTRLSSRGMADELERDEARPYLDALMDTYDRIDDHYPDLYELGIFDWWWVAKDKRGQFSKTERRKQRDLEDDLNYSLSKVLKRLNRFNFGYVNRDILGHVYEDYLPKQERKELGEYYTPLEVVQFMLDSVDYRPNEGIGRKKVLDPACGSGTFLTEVTERLIQHFLRKFNKNSIHALNADEARTILERVEENVYGIDINPFAAHITQINLLFRTIDLYDKVTEKDPYYTMDGFEVHVADTLTPTLREQKSGSSDAETMQSGLEQFAGYNGRAKSFIEDRNAVDRIKDDVEFDVVVANPPYVRIQNLSGMKDIYSSHYASAIANFDIYVPFIERGVDWLTDDGKLAYICPDRLVMADYAKAIRDQLVEEPITSLIDFKEADVFDVPTPYPCVFTLDREQVVEGNNVRCARFAEKNDGVLDKIRHLDGWRTPDNAEGYELFEYSQAQLAEDNQGTPAIWKPMPDDERQVFNKIEQTADLRLDDVSKDIFVGMQTSADKIYIGQIRESEEDGLVEFRPGGEEDYYPIEEKILKRVLKGNEIHRWKFDWQGLWVIFPYSVEGDDVKPIHQERLKDQYPNAWEFFTEDEREEAIKSRGNGALRDSDEWYAYVYPKNLDKFDSDKIMLGVLRQEPSFVPDTEGSYYFVGGGTAGGYGLRLRDEYAPDAPDTLYFGGLLNSRVTEFYHKHISFIFNSKFYSYGQTFLEPLPVVLSEDRKRISTIAGDIRKTIETITELEVRTDNISNYLPSYEKEWTVLDLAKSIDLSDDDYRQDPIRTNDKMEVSSEKVYQVVMKRGHTIDFGNEQIRDFVFMLLKAQDKRLGRTELLDLATPVPEDVVALMDEYQSDEARIEELEQEVEQLQDELDDLILRDVYGLDDAEVEVVDDFLEVW